MGHLQLKECDLKHITMVTGQPVFMQAYIFSTLDHLISQQFMQPTRAA